MTSTMTRAKGLLETVMVNFFWSHRSRQTVAVSLGEWARDHPYDRFLWFEGRWWTVGRFDAEVNRHARAYRALGLRAGDVVALLMDNRPAYLLHFYALARLGVIASLVNPNLRGESLSRTIRAGLPRLLVTGDAQLDQLAALAEGALGGIDVWVDVEGGGDPPRPWQGFSRVLQGRRGEPLGHCLQLELEDVAAFVFTSGTTGLPKPALVKHHRLYRASGAFGGILSLTEDDGLYLCLPLYHGNATMIGVPMAIAHRCRLALARRLSVSRFWRDCRESEATAFVYVGELCRYLMNAPASPEDRLHRVTRALGNGLGAEIWEPFQRRFGLERMHEFYAATEGNAETANLFGVVGSCGPLLPWKMRLIRYDGEADEPVRDEHGLCVETEADEPGLLVGKISRRNEYAGYSDSEATEDKVLRDVLRRGDAWFDSGDLLRRDKLLNLYFVDRLGDTFRWKGENVSTLEVSEVLWTAPGVVEAAVYGVEVPGHEGRAGMAALVLDGELDGEAMYHHVSAQLPDYAQPRFLRLSDQLDHTGTFRQRKRQLQREGVDAEVSDPLFVRDPESETYRPFDDEVRGQIEDGRWPL